MAGEWREMSVAELHAAGALLVEDGNHGENRPRPDEFSTEGIQFIRAADMDSGRVLFERAQRINEVARLRVRKGIGAGGDVLLSHKGTVGKVAYVPLDAPPFVCSPQTTFWRVKDDKQLDRRYIYFYLLSRAFREQLDSRKGETDMADYVSLTTQRTLKVTVPPLAEQKAIAAVLGALDDKIELNRRMNATLEALARALFQSWFVDFDPVRAKLDGRPPAPLDPATAALFPEHLEDSPLGPIPKGWKVSRLDEIASVLMGLSPNGESYNPNGVGMPLINGPVEFGDYFPVKTKWTEAATRFAAEGDLIFCVRGSTTGRRVVSDGEYGIGRGVCAFRATGGYHSFVYQTVNAGLDRLLEKTTGSVFPSLSAPDIKGFSVLKPSKGILEAYEHMTRPLIQRIQQNHHQSRTLAALRDTLLPKLLSGELSVPTAETIFEDAT